MSRLFVSADADVTPPRASLRARRRGRRRRPGLSNLAKFFWNMPTSARAVLSNSALSAQVLTGSRMCGSTPGSEVGTAKPKYVSVRNSALRKLAVERRGQQRARHLDRHAPAGAVLAAGPAGVDQPAIDIVLGDQLAQQVAVDAEDRAAGTASRSRWRIPAAARCRGRARCRRPWRCSRTGSGTSPAPASAWRSAASRRRRRRRASRCSSDGGARPVREALGMKSSG